MSAFKSKSPYISENIFSTSIKKHSHVIDFLFFLNTGIIYMILSYVTLDGEIRIHNALIFLVSFVLSVKYLYLPIECIIKIVLDKLYRVIFFVVYFLTRPFKALFGLIKKAFLPIINIFRCRLYRISLNKLIKKERRSIEDIILKLA